MLLAGKFILADWAIAGLNIETAVKLGLYTVQQNLVVKVIGAMTPADAAQLEQSLRDWLGL